VLAYKWRDLCCFLGLPPDILATIEKDHPHNAMGSLQDGLTHWLKMNYDTDMHGPPSWRKLVEAVDNPAGGRDHALALKIAKDLEHKSEVHANESVINEVICIFYSYLRYGW
jgi:hypothetical protein